MGNLGLTRQHSGRMLALYAQALESGGQGRQREARRREGRRKEGMREGGWEGGREREHTFSTALGEHPHHLEFVLLFPHNLI